MLVQVLVDNPNSWIVPYARKLVNKLNQLSKVNSARLLFKHKEVVKGDVLCLLSCERIFKNLNYNKYNLVVHESDLPKGKGWSPVTWQVLEGKNKIPVTLFEATEKVDAGAIYQQDFIILNGDELLTEIKDQQGKVTNKLILDFVYNYPEVESKEQEGESTFYERRTAESSELNVNKSITDQFNLLRVCDNERYPAFFVLNGVRYNLKIERDES